MPNGDALDIPEPDVSPIVQNGTSKAEMDESEGNLDAMGRPIPVEELFVKDAFLVFRALCKLSMKALVSER